MCGGIRLDRFDHHVVDLHERPAVFAQSGRCGDVYIVVVMHYRFGLSTLSLARQFSCHDKELEHEP